MPGPRRSNWVAQRVALGSTSSMARKTWFGSCWVSVWQRQPSQESSESQERAWWILWKRQTSSSSSSRYKGRTDTRDGSARLDRLEGTDYERALVKLTSKAAVLCMAEWGWGRTVTYGKIFSIFPIFSMATWDAGLRIKKKIRDLLHLLHWRRMRVRCWRWWRRRSLTLSICVPTCCPAP